MTNEFDIYIAFVEWDGGGKRRPVLVIGRQKDIVDVFNITTQYQNKPPAIREKYFTILDWSEAGLNKPSYVDTINIRYLQASVLDSETPIGKLSDNDKLRLIEFLNQP